MSDPEAQTRALLALLLERDPEPVALARLGKRLQMPMSALLRLIAALGEQPLGPSHPAPGWVVLAQHDGRPLLAQLSPVGRQAARMSQGGRQTG